MTLYRVDTGYYCAGLVTDDAGIVVDAAPVLAWSIGKPISVVFAWVLVNKGPTASMGPVSAHTSATAESPAEP